MSKPTVLRLAVCLFPEVASLDFIGPMELFSFISPQTVASKRFGIDSPYAIDAVYLSVSKDPLVTSSGATILPSASYHDVSEQFDILLIPGGEGTRPGICPQSVLDFIKSQAPGTKYILSMCTASEVVARAGLLTGKRATTSKISFKRIQSETRELGVEWVAKARWVVDGKIWTSSGVTAGTDMAYAFLKKLAGLPMATFIQGIVELTTKEEGDDEFAAVHGLV